MGTTAAFPHPRPKRPPTKALLIETAERLLGQHGINGISLREIAEAAGQANSNVVQYHFRDKAGLVSAILDDRVHRIEQLRREGLAQLEASEAQDPRALLKVMWLPMMSIKDADGGHSFCRFLLQYMIQRNVAPHPIEKLYKASAKSGTGADTDLPYLLKLNRLLRAQHESLPQAVFGRRLSMLSMMFLASVVEHDNARLSGKIGSVRAFDIEPILDMAIGALSVGARGRS